MICIIQLGVHGELQGIKISTIRDSLCIEDTPGHVTPLDGDVQVTLDSFAPTTNEEIIGIIKSSSYKFCNLDPILTWLLKLCTSELASIIFAIVNRSFETCRAEACPH